MLWKNFKPFGVKPLPDELKKLFSELKQYKGDEQRQKIQEIYSFLVHNDYEVSKSATTGTTFEEIDEEMGKNNLCLENSIILLKGIGFCKLLKGVHFLGFIDCPLHDRFEKLLLEEENKKEEKNEKLMIGLCECFLALFENQHRVSKDTVNICICCVMKVAMRKEEDEKTQKEVEMALLALGNVRYFECEDGVKFFDKTEEIIKYHQEHHNLTRLAYQSAWHFIVWQTNNDEKMRRVIENELNFCKETERELEELLRCVDWIKKEKEKETDRVIEVHVIQRWLETINLYLSKRTLSGDEVNGLIESVVRLCRVAKNVHNETFEKGISIFQTMIISCLDNFDYLLRGGAIDFLFQELNQSTFDEVTLGKHESGFVPLSGKTV
eukprot:MONOS_12738.1-p1 / transcript=MONOS_12738.1 / gene=MONOS_12738 / organism=Monocercomonoides_exilis_PA203 / gene_product=unspecified product / transcript_product=unspecified product / location=Mono_scaffold00727:1869-3451(-) / protein_length=381 / sequence_SO=supercontig / SO=protein_coding / is_pseudo=false